MAQQQVLISQQYHMFFLVKVFPPLDCAYKQTENWSRPPMREIRGNLQRGVIDLKLSLSLSPFAFIHARMQSWTNKQT
jgi:hypothetical protein